MPSLAPESARTAARRRSSAPVVLDARVLRGSGGGPDKTILNSPRFLKDAGYRMLCAYLRDPADPGFDRLRAKAEERGAPLVAVDDNGPLDFGVVPRLLNVCRRERVSIWHGHDYKTNALGLLLNRFWRMRLVTTVHGWVHHTARTPLYYRLDRLCLPYYEKVICVSEDLYRLSRECGVPADRCELLENGVDLDDYRRRRSAAEAKRRLNLPPQRLLVGAVGRLSAEKALDLLIRAIHQLQRDGLVADLVVVGEGDERPRLEALIAELGLADRVRLLGYRADLPDWYEAMDVFALSSLREGLPNVLLEAMALETPVVATRIAGVPRLVRHEENGLLVEPGSVEELTGALGRLLRDPDLRDRLARAGRRTVEVDYSFAVRMDKLRLLYDRMLGRV
ncbi:MAG TPA: glycosyltransferase family 1 protein [Planctomycetales bacterium]|jgi:glycosyltransferase involved in cell wall biosynthesis|nr:glycosyltransferase family 1 protein [Planctomycetales bacterium]